MPIAYTTGKFYGNHTPDMWVIYVTPMLQLSPLVKI